MKCPNCSLNVTDQSICPHCGIDIVLFARTSRTSNALFNKALEQIKVNDLSAAIELLVKSIEFNKVNYHARNLLGLVYFEVGMIGDALKQWVLSTNCDVENNLAKGYIDSVQAKSDKLEKMSDAAKMYNQAVQYLKQGSEDMALIQVKKALENNPKLLAAQNLLALCYMMEGQNEKAISIVEKVLAVDTNNKFAVSYFMQLNPNKGRHEVVEQIVVKKEKVTANEAAAYSRLKRPSKKSFSHTFHLAEIFTFLVAVIGTFAFFQLLVIPDIVNTSENEYAAMSETIANLEARYKRDMEAKENEMIDLRTEKERIELANEGLITEIELGSRIEKLNAISSQIAEGRYEEAMQALDAIDTTLFPADSIQKIADMKQTVYPILEKQFYDEGYALYDTRRYEEAKELFEKSITYAMGETAWLTESYYWLGRISERAGNNEEARAYYDRIINDYPEANRASAARTRLRNL